MTPFDHKVCYTAVAALAIIMAGCSAKSPSQMSGSTSASGGAGGSTLTGGAEAQPTSNPGVTPGSGPAGVGNMTGGAEAQPTSEPGVTPGARPKK